MTKQPRSPLLDRRLVPHPSPLSRRRWLTSLAATALVPALARCGGGSADAWGGSLPFGHGQARGATGPMPPREADRAAPEGKLLYTADADVWIWEKGNARHLSRDRISRQPCWSPDGRSIAHVKLDTSSSEIWVMDADSANSRQLTRNYHPVAVKGTWAFRPVWWPDGTRLLYLTQEAGHEPMLWQTTLDGKSRRPFLAVPDGEGGLDMPSVAPDGKRLAAVTYRAAGARSQVWVYTLPQGPWRQLTDSVESTYDPAWSPDGTRIAYTARRQGRHDVWVVAADGSNPQPITRNGASRAPCWSPNGQLLAFLSAEKGGFDIWVAAASIASRGTSKSPVAEAGSPTSIGPAATIGETLPVRRLTHGGALDAVSGLSWTK